MDISQEKEGVVTCLMVLVDMNASIEENNQKEEEKSSSNKAVYNNHTLSCRLISIAVAT
jgi:hypothetical protein